MPEPATHPLLLHLAAAGQSAPHTMLLTMTTAIAAGVMLIVLARRLNLPGVVLLLAAGVALGPEGLAWVRPDELGDGLPVIVSLAVGLILFEGGLTLDVSGYRSAPAMIKRLLTVGVVTTWGLITAAIWLIVFKLDPAKVDYAILSASLVIVTGPTVISPLLKRLKITPKLHSILHWEGVLIDPIGVFIAVLCFEFVVSGHSGVTSVTNLGVRVASGLGLGVVGGLLISFVYKRRVVPEDMVNVFAIACAVLVFGLAELIRPEAGLLSVTVAGFVFGLTGSHKVRQIREFKAEITDLLIGTLFILLAAGLTFDQFESFGLRGLAVVAIVVFAVRPLSVLICSIGLDLEPREKVFLGWIAPRGIVAASMASLFAISIADRARALPEGGAADTAAAIVDAQFVETFVYSIIVATIALQGLSAGPLARLLGLRRPEATGWLIVGAHAFARRVAAFIAETAKLPVIVVDTNARAVRDARAEGLSAFNADARETAFAERYGIHVVGNVLALTDNEDLNVRLCQIWSKVVGSDHVHRCNPSGIEPPADEEEEESKGRIVWPRLPRPSLLAGELMRGEASVFALAAPASARPSEAAPILVVRDGRLAFDFETTEASDAPRDAQPPPTLYLRREADYLRRSLRPELIVTLDASDLRSLFEELVGRIVTLHPGLPKRETVEELVDRETGFPTTLGHGVSVPHAYSSALEARVCAIARLPHGLDLGAPDGEPVRLVFLVLSPTGDPEGHLATLADIARRVIDPDLRERLMHAPSPLEVMNIVRETRVG